MLKGLFQSREDKNRERIENHIAAGLKQLSSKFYNGAMIEFEKAMEISTETAYPRLLKELDNAAGSGQLEAALAIGLNLLKGKSQDFKLANKLGNYARELKDYKQASGLYKTSLKINKNFQLAFYNLAAAEAKVDIFDEAIAGSLAKFDKVHDYILPDYFGEDDLIQNYTARATENKESRLKESINKLMIERDRLIADSETVEAQGIDLRINKLKGSSKKITADDVILEFLSKIKEDPKNAKEHRFNLALYALAKKKPKMALKALNALSNKDFDTVELLKTISLAEKGQLGKAIDQLVKLLGNNEFNRYNNVNLGFMFRKAKKKFLATKYLIKTSALLDKSGGIYSMKELLKIADSHLDQGKFVKALNFYQIAVTEIPSAELWNKIGTIYVDRKKYDDAAGAFREMIALDPNSEAGAGKLREIHAYYVDKGESLFTDRKYKPAADYFDKALRIIRSPETIKRAAETYKQLNDPEKEKELIAELQGMMDEEKEKQQEETRLQLIKNAKTLMAKKKYAEAVKIFETAFRMKADQNIFVQLAALYKALKRGDDLALLEERWEKMLAHEEKIKKFEKEQERMQQG